MKELFQPVHTLFLLLTPEWFVDWLLTSKRLFISFFQMPSQEYIFEKLRFLVFLNYKDAEHKDGQNESKIFVIPIVLT